MQTTSTTLSRVTFLQTQPHEPGGQSTLSCPLTAQATSRGIRVFSTGQGHSSKQLSARNALPITSTSKLSWVPADLHVTYTSRTSQSSFTGRLYLSPLLCLLGGSQTRQPLTSGASTKALKLEFY